MTMGGAGPGGGGGQIGAYMSQGVPQAPTGFGSGVSMPGSNPAWGVGQSGGGWGVTSSPYLDPWISGLEQYGLQATAPALLNWIKKMAGGGGPGQPMGGPYRHAA